VGYSTHRQQGYVTNISITYKGTRDMLRTLLNLPLQVYEIDVVSREMYVFMCWVGRLFDRSQQPEFLSCETNEGVGFWDRSIESSARHACYKLCDVRCWIKCYSTNNTTVVPNITHDFRLPTRPRIDLRSSGMLLERRVAIHYLPCSTLYWSHIQGYLRVTDFLTFEDGANTFSGNVGDELLLPTV
jgi:hypothetical protein